MDEIWVEKYRPQKLAEVVGQKTTTSRLSNYVKEKSMPHLMFSGPAGTGKTSSAIALAKEMFKENWKYNVHMYESISIYYAYTCKFTDTCHCTTT